MSNLLIQPIPQSESECAATVTQLLYEMERLNEKIQHDQVDIDRLKSESDRLKIEGKRLDGEARVRLNCLYTVLDQIGGPR